MKRLLLVVVAALLPGMLEASLGSLNPGDRLMITFKTSINTGDLLLLFNNDNLTITGAPVFTTSLYNGQSLLGVYTSKPVTSNGVSSFTAPFVSSASNFGGVFRSSTKIDFSAINHGTIDGRLVTTVSGGSVSGFYTEDFILYDAKLGTAGYGPLDDVNRTSLKLASAMMLPHLASGDTWTTGIYVMNTGPQPANFSVTFYGDSGSPVSLPFTNASMNTLNGTVAAFGSSYFETGDPTAALSTGWGLVTADPSIVIQGLFRHNVNGAYFEAAVPSSKVAGGFQVPFDNTVFSPLNTPIYTGLAIANTDASNPANITCVAKNSAGTVIPHAISVPMLKPFGHWSDYVFPALTGQRGTLGCTSNTNVAALALRFIGNAFSTLSVAPSDSLQAPGGLKAPEHSSPADGTIFTSAYPRTMTVSWTSVDTAATYGVELDCFQCCQQNQWCTEVGSTYQIADGLTNRNYKFDWVGAQWGRWRIWAVDAAGQKGEVSDWWGFRWTQ